MRLIVHMWHSQSAKTICGLGGQSLRCPAHIVRSTQDTCGGGRHAPNAWNMCGTCVVQTVKHWSGHGLLPLNSICRAGTWLGELSHHPNRAKGWYACNHWGCCVVEGKSCQKEEVETKICGASRGPARGRLNN